MGSTFGVFVGVLLEAIIGVIVTVGVPREGAIMDTFTVSSCVVPSEFVGGFLEQPGIKTIEINRAAFTNNQVCCLTIFISIIGRPIHSIH